jgi:hypothetical protein
MSTDIYQTTPDDPCISLYCFHARDYHAPNCVFSGCTCRAFEEAPTEAEAEAILREQGIDPKQLTNDFIEYLFRHVAKQSAELALREQRISELEARVSEAFTAFEEDNRRARNAEAEVERLRKANEEVWNATTGIVRAKFEVCDTLNTEAAGPLKQVLKELEAARQSREKDQK